ncbi:MAG: outer membrane protein assembly factor BamA [Planktomarina sp.]
MARMATLNVGSEMLKQGRMMLIALSALVLVLSMALPAAAQSFRVNAIDVSGNQRIESSTILTFAGIQRGAVLSGSQVNDAIQRVRASGLFESVDADVRGNTLVLRVVEFPTVSAVAFEGNRRLNDQDLSRLVSTSTRRVYNAAQAEADTAVIAEAYANQGRILATVEPRIIRRADNRVDVVFEIAEGGVVEIERISFVGNRSFSDRRLRRVLATKQAGIFRLLVGRDTFVEDRIEFDKQVLRDFYQSRGYVDFQTLDVNSELGPNQDGFFLTFRVREGQPFRFGGVTVSSDLPDVDTTMFQRALQARASGKSYSPAVVENTITRLEVQAVSLGLDFIRVEPRVTRNDADQTLDVDYMISRGPKVFVERIDIEGNTTTLDRVIRAQFDAVEGDPFNPRSIRASAERIRALGFFGNADINAREGSDPSQVVIDVDVAEVPTGSFNFGVNFNSSDGVGFLVNFREQNFLGRGQSINTSLQTGSDSRSFRFSFAEPNLLDRDLRFGMGINYRRTDGQNAQYDTETYGFSPSLAFPIGEQSRLSLKTFYESEELFNATTTSGAILAEAATGAENAYGIGYTYSFDSRRRGADEPNRFFFRFGQDFALGGDQNFIRSNLEVGVETKVLNEDMTLSAVLEAGALHFSSGTSRVTDRFFPNSDTFRGFDAGGIGPREINGTDNDALGGDYYAVARFEAQFPLGLPEEYGITGGAFVDVGSVWGLDPQTIANATAAGGTVLSDDFSLRSIAGVSLFWKTPIGPLRFNFSRPIGVESFDQTENFDLTISTTF